ncbi:unnamed protein product, partial [Laminaria digitata]
RLSRGSTRPAANGAVLRGTFVEPPPSDDEQSWEQSWEKGTDNSRWEKVWQEGEKEKRTSSFLSSMADWDAGESGGPEGEVAMPVEVVSFDLDDTLWSTKGVIEAANAALQEYMSREHPVLAEKCVISDLMKEVWKEKLAANPKLDAAPVNLTELRKAGLTRACEMTETDPATVVESCFEVWRRARHDVEPYLFPGALETLATLKGRGVRLVAITNGNAQTDDIPCLKDLFEFCVLAEQVGERKPQSGPFREAIRRAGYPSENHVGGEWVHVGDDWATDCVGAKTMRMRTVLVRVPGKQAVGQAPVEDDDGQVDAADQGDDDEDDDFSVLEDDGLKESGPIGSAWRVSEDKEKAKRRAERLGLTIQGDFEVAVGTAGINKEKPAPQGNPATATIPVPETPEGGNERPAKPDSLDGGTYGEEMSAIAMGDHASLQGPGKVMSMGSSSYVTDMIQKDFMDAALDDISEVVDLVDEWNANYASNLEVVNRDGPSTTDGTVAQRATSSNGGEK